MTNQNTPPVGSDGSHGDKPNEKPREKSHEEPQEKPAEGPGTKPTPSQEVRCPHCGSIVVPKIIETSTGGERWTCPECTKLMPMPKARHPGEKKESIYRGEVNEREILYRVLDGDPDLSQKHIDEVMKWSEFSKIDPFALTHLLTTMKDVRQSTATRIGFKFQAALSTARGEGPPSYPMFLSMFQQQGGVPFYPLQGGGASPFLPTPQSWPTPQWNHPSPFQSSSQAGLSEERLLRILDEREKRNQEEREKNTFARTLDKISQALDNLHKRISTIEQGGNPTKHIEEDPLRAQINSVIAKKLSATILEEPSLEKLKTIAREIRGSAPPPGTRSEYDMRVEQAQHEAEARKIEAQEKRKGYEAVAGGIRDGLQGLGFNVGAGLSVGPTGMTPTPAQRNVMEPSEPQLPTRGADGQLYVECPHCRAPLMVPEGQARVVCSSCGGIVSIITREEELKQKTSTEKSEAPEIETETKKEKPKREKPQKEKPQKEEEKLPETEEPQEYRGD